MSNRKRRGGRAQTVEKEADTSTSDTSEVTTSNTSTTENSQEDTRKPFLPESNVKERIIIVLDRVEDEKTTLFTHKQIELNPLQMLKMAVENFIQAKHYLDHKHEFALMTLNESTSTWLVNFTSNLRAISNALKKIQPCETEDIFDLNTAFDLISKNATTPSEQDLGMNIREPPFILRVVLFYGRSYTLINFDKTDEVNILLNSPFFNVDVLVTHENVDADNKCDKIFESLQNLDCKAGSYFCPVGRDSKLLAEAMAKLLAHPLQRPVQKNQKTCELKELLTLLN